MCRRSGHVSAPRSREAPRSTSTYRRSSRSTAAFGRALARPWTVRWRDALRIAEQVGANGFPVVTLVSMLVGFIIAFQSAGQLKRYGADLMVADLIALT